MRCCPSEMRFSNGAVTAFGCELHSSEARTGCCLGWVRFPEAATRGCAEPGPARIAVVKDKNALRADLEKRAVTPELVRSPLCTIAKRVNPRAPTLGRARCRRFPRRSCLDRWRCSRTAPTCRSRVQHRDRPRLGMRSRRHLGTQDPFRRDSSRRWRPAAGRIDRAQSLQTRKRWSIAA
jgi:hypothetical protein